MSVSKLIDIMRTEGSKYNPPLPIVGEVISLSPFTVESNNIEFDDDDLYIVQPVKPFVVGQTVILLPTVGSKYAVLGTVNT